MEFALPLEMLNNMPWIWLGLAILMTIVEGLTMGLTTVWLALAALVCMILSFFIPSLTLQITIFLVLSIGMLLFTRPFALKKMKMGKVKTNSDRLVGMKGIVQIAVSQDNPGQVKVGGQIWTARPEDKDHSYQADEQVQVIRIEGVTIIVAKPSDMDPA
ncbi:MAG: NfeD family protein [Spirochaetales bacterium]|nr:NfeD family protein [Spirochaetales bacterium]